MPAKAGIHILLIRMDSRLRGNDILLFIGLDQSANLLFQLTL